MSELSNKKVSVCIVTLNASRLLDRCLNSLEKSRGVTINQIIVVDNRSQDDTINMIKDRHSSVHLLTNSRNEGYTGPINQALQQATGDYYLVLNPDAFVRTNSIALLARFLDLHPDVGICGPKVLNEDLTFQQSCRRGVARPWNVISYFSGLATYFPKNSKFSGYHLSYLDEDRTCAVDGVSGSCLMIRREVVEEIGLFDERFFAYQEDSDYCFRAKTAGWKVYYVPEAQVIHHAGRGGSAVQRYRSIFEWHRSYYRLYKKHFAEDYFPLFNVFFYSLMLGKLMVTVFRETLRS